MFLKFFKIDDPKYLDMLSHAGTVGLHLVSATFIGMAMGYFLDRWLGTKPWLMLIFLLFGIAAGFKNVYLETKRILRQQEEIDAGKSSGEAPGPTPVDADGGEAGSWLAGSDRASPENGPGDDAGRVFWDDASKRGREAAAARHKASEYVTAQRRLAEAAKSEGRVRKLLRGGKREKDACEACEGRANRDKVVASGRSAATSDVDVKSDDAANDVTANPEIDTEIASVAVEEDKSESMTRMLREMGEELRRERAAECDSNGRAGDDRSGDGRSGKS